MYASLYSREELQRDLQEAGMVIRNLFGHWVKNPSQLPSAAQPQLAGEGVPRVVADYIAGMTDHYILTQYAEWQKRR